MRKILAYFLSGMFAFAASVPVNFDTVIADSILYMKSTDSIATTQTSISAYEKPLDITEPDKLIGTVTDFPAEISKLNVKDGGKYILKDSSNKSAILVVDDTKPEILVNGIEKDGVYKEASAEITVQDANLKSESVLLDDKAVEKKDGKYDISVKPTTDDVEVHKIEVSAEDKAGNISRETFSFKVYDKVPEIEVSGLDEVIKNKAYTIKATVKSKLETTNKAVLKKDDKVISSAELFEKGITLNEEGKYTLDIEATDKAGNKATYTKSFEIDKTAPVVTASEVPEFTNQDVSIAVTTELGTENTFKLNGVACESNVEVTREGTYSFYYKSVDAAGNVTEDTIRFTIDKTKPVVQVSDIPECTNKDVKISIKTEEHSINKVTLDGKDIEGTTEFNTTVTKEGKHTLTYKSTDRAGNVTEGSVNFVIDKTDPKVNVSDISAYEKDDFDIVITTESNLSGKVTYDKKTVERSEDGSYQIQAQNEGKHSLSYSFKDEAGNITEDKIEFVIDKTTPVIKFNNIEYVKKLDDVVASSTDAYGEIDYMTLQAKSAKKTSDKKTVHTNKINIFDTALSDGRVDKEAWELTATVTDKAGNTATLKKKVVKDDLAPRLKISGPITNAICNKDTTVHAKVTDANVKKSTMTITKGGKTVKTLTGKGSLSYKISAEGVYAVKATCTDKAGNVTNESVTHYRIDKKIPVVKITAPSGNHKKVSKVSAVSNEDGTVKLTIKRNGKVIDSVSAYNKAAVYTKIKSDGNYEISAYAGDLAGNKSKTVKKSFIVDTAKPKVSLVGANQGRFYNNPVNITARVQELNFKTDKVYFTGVHDGKKFQASFNSKSKISAASKTFSAPGKYTVQLKATDKAGNTASAKPISFTIDTKKPVIKVTVPKVINKTSKAAPKVTVSDENYKSNSITLSKKGDGIVYKDSFGKTGGTRTYEPFKKVRANDGKYSMIVNVEDKAGNITTVRKDFIVNRYGSTFKIVTKPAKQGQTPDKDMVIRETNLSEIASYKVEIARDSSKTEVNNVKAVKKGNSQTYTIPKENFTEDGVYKVYITSKDKAGNTTTGGNNYSFVVDKTAPVITYNGLDSNETYKFENVNLYVDASDTLSDISNISVVANDNPVMLNTDSTGTYATIQSGYGQNIQITATDSVGNSSMVQLDNVNITTSPFAFVMTHKLLVAIIFLALIGTGLFVAIRATRKTEEIEKIEEEESDIVL